MGLSKNKIHLSRTLHAQTTPYPHATRHIRNFAIFATLLVLVGVFVFAAPVKKDTPTATEQPKQILGEQEAAVEYLNYEIKKGDTLFNLSQKYEVSWQTLAEINQLKEPFILKIGQKIKIPQ